MLNKGQLKSLHGHQKSAFNAALANPKKVTYSCYKSYRYFCCFLHPGWHNDSTWKTYESRICGILLCFDIKIQNSKMPVVIKMPNTLLLKPMGNPMWTCTQSLLVDDCPLRKNSAHFISVDDTVCKQNEPLQHSCSNDMLYEVFTGHVFRAKDLVVSNYPSLM